jgi:hypothetical protein
MSVIVPKSRVWSVASGKVPLWFSSASASAQVDVAILT